MDRPPRIPNLDPPSRAPWVLAIVAILAAGGAGYYAMTQRKELAGTDQERRDLMGKVRESDNKARELQKRVEQLENDNAALTRSKDELSKDVAAKEEELAKLKGTADQLRDKLKAELKGGDVSLEQTGGKLRVGLVDKILFESGEAKISKRGENVLEKVGSILAKLDDKHIQVSGHTDVWPIGEKRSALFPTNWELSVSRATNVVRFLQEKAGVPGERLAASGYGEFQPIASNKSSTGRARNRRIEILLTPALAPRAVSRNKLEKVASEKVASKKK
jgi:chemotaxis protein MotB